MIDTRSQAATKKEGGGDENKYGKQQPEKKTPENIYLLHTHMIIKQASLI